MAAKKKSARKTSVGDVAGDVVKAAKGVASVAKAAVEVLVERASSGSKGKKKSAKKKSGAVKKAGATVKKVGAKVKKAASKVKKATKGKKKSAKK